MKSFDMSVQLRIKINDLKNYKTKDFIRKGILITGVMRFRLNDNQYLGHRVVPKEIPSCRIWFRGENLFAEIRSCSDGKFAVDVQWAHEKYMHKSDMCLTTECNTMQEAKNVVYAWFKSKGFHYMEGTRNAYFPEYSTLSNYKPIVEYYL